MNDKFSLDMVSIRLITDKKLYSDTAINSPEKAVSLIGQEIASFDREWERIYKIIQRMKMEKPL